jgi:hypothetical protein
MTAAKEEELKKKHHGTKYNDVYRILFPNEPCPLSPCMFTGGGRFASGKYDAYSSQITMMAVSTAFKTLL